MGPGNGGMPNRNFNGAPQPRVNNFNAPPSVTEYNSEPTPINNPEQFKSQVETRQNQTPVPQNTEPLPVMPVVTTTTQSDQAVLQQGVAVTTTGDSGKTVDADALEKVWVDKAKDTIEKTKMDPHSEAHQIAELMKGYLKERYGKIVGEKSK